MAEHERPIAAVYEASKRDSTRPTSSETPFWRRWLLGFEILLLNLALFQFINWTSDAIRSFEGANAVLRIGLGAIAIVFALICIPLLAYELAFWVVLHPSNRLRIQKSMRSNRRESEGS